MRLLTILPHLKLKQTNKSGIGYWVFVDQLEVWPISNRHYWKLNGDSGDSHFGLISVRFLA